MCVDRDHQKLQHKVGRTGVKTLFGKVLSSAFDGVFLIQAVDPRCKTERFAGTFHRKERTDDQVDQTDVVDDGIGVLGEEEGF